MKEVMKKRFFTPIWKCEEIETKLEQLENNGWKLNKISGFRKFQFVKSSPKATKYFVTCSFVKESGMIQAEQLLKSQYKATQINGNFIEGLKTTSVYRITKEADLHQRKIYRNRYLSHLVLQYIFIGLFLEILSIAGLILSCTLNGIPLFDARHIFFAFAGICGAIVLLRHWFGWLYLRKQYIGYLQSNQE